MTTYPLSLPTVTKIRKVDFRSINVVAYEQSPFTFAGQAQASAGQMWAVDVTLPPMKRADAAVWLSWLISLRGQFGTFLMGDPNATTAQGTPTGTPVVNGAGQTGQALNIDGCTTGVTNWLKAGDYIQLGSGSRATLHMVLEDVDSDGSGEATLSLWPHIRSAPVDGSIVVVASTVGRWRLAENTSNWSISEISTYGISFTAMEAV